jgi:Carboxymuconolactone decarboxylase family
MAISQRRFRFLLVLETERSVNTFGLALLTEIQDVSTASFAALDSSPDSLMEDSRMPRLSKLSAEQVDGDARQIFDRFQKERGNVPNMFRTIAHRPEIMKTMTDHFRAVMNSGTVDKRLKEMVAVRVSHLNRCEY